MNAIQQMAMLGLAIGLGFGTGIHWWDSGISWQAVASGTLVGVFGALAIFTVATSRFRFLAGLRSDLGRVLTLFLPARRYTDLLFLSVLAGIGEEAIFRGFLQTWIATFAGTGAAIGICALLFGLVHWISWRYCAYITVLGVVFGMVTWIFGGPWVAMIAHAVFNFAGLALGVKYLAPRFDPYPRP